MFAMMTIYIPKYENQTLLTKKKLCDFRSDLIHNLQMRPMHHKL